MAEERFTRFYFAVNGADGKQLLRVSAWQEVNGPEHIEIFAGDTVLKLTGAELREVIRVLETAASLCVSAGE